MHEAVTAVDVVKNYGAQAALHGLSFAVNRGEIFGIVGPDGAGKTTLLRILAGVLDKTSGRISILGRDADAAREEIKRFTGYMSQKFNLYPTLTVEENIVFFAGIFGVPAAEYRERVPGLLSLTGLAPFTRRQARDLSGGMKQKLALVATLIHQPELLILDEPTLGVDPVSRRDFWQILQDFSSRGTSIIVSTSYMDEAELCTRILLLFSGRILLEGNPAEIKKMGDAVLEITVPPGGAADGEMLAQLARAARNVSWRGQKIRAILPRGEAGTFTGRWGTECRIREIPPTVEDIFVDQVTRHE